MSEASSRPVAAFWQPEFNITKRDDGSILMKQIEPLGKYPQKMPEKLIYWADQEPDRPFLAQRDRSGEWNRLSYKKVLDYVRAIGTGLLGAGASPENPLIIISENSIDHALLGLAAQYIGLPYCPVSPAYSLLSHDHGKLRDIAANLQPGIIYAADGEKYAAAIAAIRQPQMRLIVSGNPASDQDAILLSDLRSLKPSEEADRAYQSVDGNTIAKFLFTSGSTGSPKAVINLQKMMTSNQAMIADCFRFFKDRPPVVVDWAPWNHTASGNKVFNMVLYNGGTYYIDQGKPAPIAIGETIRNLKEISPTWYFNVPAGFDLLVNAFENDHQLCENFFKNLDLMMYAGAGMAQRTWDMLLDFARQTTGRDILLTSGLGATETGPFTLMCTSPQKFAGNVGLPAREVTLKLVPCEGKLEARLKSPSITPGYFNEPALTRQAFDAEGFYKLGDALRPADEDDLTRGFFFDGRVAENFKLRTGTWVAVGALRTSLINHFQGLISDAVIIGENRNYISALVFANEDACRIIASRPLDERTFSAVLKDPDLRQFFENKLTEFTSASTGSATRVSKVLLMEEPANFDKGEVTDKGSINQKAVINNRQDDVNALYDCHHDCHPMVISAQT